MMLTFRFGEYFAQSASLSPEILNTKFLVPSQLPAPSGTTLFPLLPVATLK